MANNNITIKNLRKEQPTEPWQVRVDRQSMLGNPFRMNNQSNEERDRVVDLYKDHFYTILNENLYYAEVMYLIDTYKKYGKLELFCWCAPKRCHADVIKEFIEERLK